MRTFDFHAPTALKEALELLNRGDRSRPLAGGTDLVVQMKEAATKFTYPPSVISLLRVPELQGIEFDQSNGLDSRLCDFIELRSPRETLAFH